MMMWIWWMGCGGGKELCPKIPFTRYDLWKIRWIPFELLFCKGFILFIYIYIANKDVYLSLSLCVCVHARWKYIFHIQVFENYMPYFICTRLNRTEGCGEKKRNHSFAIGLVFDMVDYSILCTIIVLSKLFHASFILYSLFVFLCLFEQQKFSQ